MSCVLTFLCRSLGAPMSVLYHDATSHFYLANTTKHGINKKPRKRHKEKCTEKFAKLEIIVFVE